MSHIKNIDVSELSPQKKERLMQFVEKTKRDIEKDSEFYVPKVETVNGELRFYISRKKAE